MTARTEYSVRWTEMKGNAPFFGSLAELGTASQKYMYEPRHEKTCLRGFRPGKTQTNLLSYID